NAANAMASNGITWKVLPYPEEPPGWTIGDIILTLMQEAIDRGVTSLSMLTPTFTGSVDSNGDPWEDKLDWSFRIGDKLYNVIEKAEELLCDIWVDPDTLELHAVKERGVDRSVYKYDVDGISVLESPI